MSIGFQYKFDPIYFPKFGDMANPEGYAKLGLLKGEYLELGIFRRYVALNAQNILYLQAELFHLETQFRQLAKEDQMSDEQERKDCAVDWWSLQRPIKPSAPAIRHRRQWNKFLEIRKKLQEYSMKVRRLLEGSN